MMRRVLFLTANGRAAGNSVTVARLETSALGGAAQDWRALTASAALPAFADLRHGKSYGTA